MKNYIKYILLFCCAGTPSQAQLDNALSQKILEIRNSNKVPALAALSIKNGEVVELAAVGVRKSDEPTLVTQNDKFHLGSDTKAMTATLTAMFIDEGKLNWTTTLAEIFHDLKEMNSDYKSVTVEMLLAHRSGITGDLSKFENGKLLKKLRDPKLDPTTGRILLVREMLTQPPAFKSGSRFEYSNQGYAVVGAILEKISNKSWEDLMQERLFSPLNMNSCGFGPLGDSNGKIVDQPWAHIQTQNGPVPVILDNPETLGPAATVHCSLQDWSKFVALHLNAYNGKPKLLSSVSFLKLHTIYPGQQYTYGGWIRTERSWAGGVVFTHDGSNTLNYATAWWAPNRNLIMLSTSNIGAPSGQTATQEAINLLVEAQRIK